MSTRTMVPDHDLGKVCPGVGVGVIILGTGRFPHLGDHNDGAARILMGLRGQLRTRPGGPGVRNEPDCWDFPGGGVDFGETRAEAVVREIYEELHVRIGQLEELGTIDHILRNAEGRVQEHWLTTTFLARPHPDTPEPAVPEAERTKIVRLWYFSARELRRMPLAESVHPSLTLLRQRHPELTV